MFVSFLFSLLFLFVFFILALQPWIPNHNVVHGPPLPAINHPFQPTNPPP
jgi:hypothetical protein